MRTTAFLPQSLLHASKSLCVRDARHPVTVSGCPNGLGQNPQRLPWLMITLRSCQGDGGVGGAVGYLLLSSLGTGCWKSIPKSPENPQSVPVEKWGCAKSWRGSDFPLLGPVSAPVLAEAHRLRNTWPPGISRYLIAPLSFPNP